MRDSTECVFRCSFSCVRVRARVHVCMCVCVYVCAFAVERERTWLLDGPRDRHALRLWVSRPSSGRWRFTQKRQNGSSIYWLEKKKGKATKQSGTRGRGLQLKSAWIGSIYTGVSWHADRGAVKAFNRWIGEGWKATLVGAPAADILAAAIETLRRSDEFCIWPQISYGLRP